MAGFRASQTQTDPDNNFLDGIIWAGLLAGFAVFLAVSFRTDPTEPNGPSSFPSPTAARADLNAKETATANPKGLELRATRTPAEKTLVAPVMTRRPAIAERHVKPAVAAKPVIQETAIATAKQPPIKPTRPTEQELLAHLENHAVTIGLDEKQAETVLEKLRTSKPARSRLSRPHDLVLAQLPETTINSLPFTEGIDCRLDPDDARSLDTFSSLLHRRIDLTRRSIQRRHPTTAFSRRDEAVARAIEKDRRCQTVEAIPSLVQILQVEAEPVRGQLVKLLAEHPDAEATRGIVNRAVFDLSPKIRRKAVGVLKKRPPKYSRGQLLEALRYPWSPAAWHAAEALVVLNDQKAVPDLIELLDAPDPAKPYADETGTFMVREVVRIRHMQNCLLCHPTSRNKNDFVRKTVPDPSAPCRPSPYGPSNRQPRSIAEVFVRADVTYLRQDFSVTHDAGNSPFASSPERFDYLVRTREARPEEIAAAESTPAESDFQYPQRKAVLFALQQLTGRNPGREVDDWLALKR